jgi:signal transduction histidine kinase
MKEKILLVDDEAGICKVLGISLRDAGYEVATAENGLKALEMFDQVAPRIVITDIKMPAMDGIELLSRIKQRREETEVIMITGHGDIDLAIRSLKLDATDFITRPISNEALEVALKRAEDKISMKRRLREYTENLERLVQEKTEKLIEAERMAAVGQTVADLSHAIKNIAGGLKGGSFVLEKGLELNDRSYLRQGWELVRTSVEKITRLSLDLLNFTKADTLQCRMADPNQPAREVCRLMADVAARAGVDLHLEPDECLAPLCLDPEGIHRCLLNLVTNALDACSDAECRTQSKTITIRTFREAQWGVCYQVVDTCGGIPAAVREKLFTRFYTTKGSRGTGIGLMLSKRIADQHSGLLEVASQENKGATFTLKIPSGLPPSPAP